MSVKGKALRTFIYDSKLNLFCSYNLSAKVIFTLYFDNGIDNDYCKN